MSFIHNSKKYYYPAIGKCILNDDEIYYYDKRMGDVIPISLLHRAYRQITPYPVKPVSDVVLIKRDNYIFNVYFYCNNSLENTQVEFDKIDKSFICKEYDPKVLINAIILNSEFTEFLIDNEHPIKDNKYLVKYAINFEGTDDMVTEQTISIDSKLNKRNTKHIKDSKNNKNEEALEKFLEINFGRKQNEIIDIEGYFPSDDSDNIDQSDCDNTNDSDTDQNDCDSCENEEIPQISLQELRDMENLFGTNSDDDNEKKYPNILYEGQDEDTELNDMPIPPSVRNNLIHTAMPRKLHNDNAPFKNIRLHMNRIEFLTRMESINKENVYIEIEPLTPIDPAIVPKIESRIDNIDF